MTSHSMKNLACHSLPQIKVDYATKFSLPQLYNSLKKVGTMFFFELGSERITALEFAGNNNTFGDTSIIVVQHNRRLDDFISTAVSFKVSFVLGSFPRHLL